MLIIIFTRDMFTAGKFEMTNKTKIKYRITNLNNFAFNVAKLIKTKTIV